MSDTRFSSQPPRAANDPPSESRGQASGRASDADVLRKRLQYAWDEIAHLSQALKEARSALSDERTAANAEVITAPQAPETESADPDNKADEQPSAEFQTDSSSPNGAPGGPDTQQIAEATRDLDRVVTQMQRRVEALTLELAGRQQQCEQLEKRLQKRATALVALHRELEQRSSLPTVGSDSAPAAGPDEPSQGGRSLSAGAAVPTTALVASEFPDLEPSTLPPGTAPIDEPTAMPGRPVAAQPPIAGSEPAESAIQPSPTPDGPLPNAPATDLASQLPKLPTRRWPRVLFTYLLWTAAGLLLAALVFVVWHSQPTGVPAEDVPQVEAPPAEPAAPPLPDSVVAQPDSSLETPQPPHRAKPVYLRDRLRSGGLAPRLVALGPGSFTMGGDYLMPDPTESPAHPVKVGRFLIATTEVTFADYDRFARETGGALPDDFGWGRGQRPVIGVSWNDAVAYTRWLSSQTGERYRLPTEAEWEYAARAGTGTFYWWGNDKGVGNAVCFDCGSRWDNERTAPVASLSPNPFGLYDTSGNVAEWVADCWFPDYNGAASDGSARTAAACPSRVARGGAFNKPATSMRGSTRQHFDPITRIDMLGFRVARDI